MHKDFIDNLINKHVRNFFLFGRLYTKIFELFEKKNNCKF